MYFGKPKEKSSSPIALRNNTKLLNQQASHSRTEAKYGLKENPSEFIYSAPQKNNCQVRMSMGIR
jgi:hypothetical protein